MFRSLLVALFSFASYCDFQLSAQDEQNVRALAEAYSRNRESFTLVDCRFTWTEQTANSIQDAIAGQFFEEQSVRHGFWLVDNGYVRYELVCDEKSIQDGKKAIHQSRLDAQSRDITRGLKKGFTPVPCLSRFYLRSPEFSLRYGPFNSAANLFPKGDVDPEGIRISPFNLDCLGSDEYSNPARYLVAGASGRFPVQVHGLQRIDERELIMATAGTAGRFRMGLDPNRGHLLAYASDSDPQSKERFYEMHLLDASSFSGNRWFPMRAITILAPDSPPPYTVRVLEVTALTVDEPIARDLFALRLAEGTQVNMIGRKQWTNLKEAEDVHADDLPALQMRCIDTGEAYQRRLDEKQKPLSSTGSASTRGAFLALNTLAIVCVAAGMVLFRRRG